MTGLIRRNNFAPRAPSRNEFLTPFDRVFDDMLSSMFPTFSRDLGEDFFAKGSYPKVNVVNRDTSIDIEAAINDIFSCFILYWLYFIYFRFFININSSNR